jgi:CubicO group peptidase (beta-lactamase class C family)
MTPVKINATRALELDRTINRILAAGRIPGGAVAVAAEGRLIYKRGFGYRDVNARLPVTTDTVYPVASTTKAINATMLAMLVEEGLLDWDAPVQRYLPTFKLSDSAISNRVTVRDLITMRTGLPRHDWVWSGARLDRAALAKRLAHLALSADLRQRFQYNNLTVTLAGHLAELVTGESWEELIHKRILTPLGMKRTTFSRPRGNVTSSYHENLSRRLIPTRRRVTLSVAPAGGAIHSTVEDMARWVSLNLERGRVGQKRLLGERMVEHVHSPQIVIGERPLADMPANGTYALGWVVDAYNGQRRVSHGGYLHDVHSSVMLFPDAGLGLVSFTNFGCPTLSDLINEHVIDCLLGRSPSRDVADKLQQYEKRIEETSRRIASLERARNAPPSRPTRAHVGVYRNPGYGDLRIEQYGNALAMVRFDLRLPLRHWHYDVWAFKDNDIRRLHLSHAFDPASTIQFGSDARGHVTALTIRLDTEVDAIRFEKRSSNA